MIKFILSLILLTSFVKCNRSSGTFKLKDAFARQKKLEVFELNYGDSAGTSFYNGYSVRNTKMLDKDKINALSKAFSDSSNYITDRSKNCVLAAHYGFKFQADSSQYVVLIGRQPCMKVAVLNPGKNTEQVFDLADSNSISTFFEQLF